MRLSKAGFLAAALMACTGGDDGSSDSSATTDSGGEAAVECSDNVCVLSGTITEDLTLTNDIAWLLRLSLIHI